MRFMVIVKATESSEAGKMASEELLSAGWANRLPRSASALVVVI